MASTASVPSLMDDKEFVAELDVLESDVRGFVSRTPKSRSWSTTAAEPPEELGDLYHFDEPAGLPPETEPARDRLSVYPLTEAPPAPRTLWGGTAQRIPVLLFTLFMCLGASGAAAVFHARVEQIVAHWHTAR